MQLWNLQRVKVFQTQWGYSTLVVEQKDRVNSNMCRRHLWSWQTSNPSKPKIKSSDNQLVIGLEVRTSLWIHYITFWTEYNHVAKQDQGKSLTQFYGVLLFYTSFRVCPVCIIKYYMHNYMHNYMRCNQKLRSTRRTTPSLSQVVTLIRVWVKLWPWLMTVLFVFTTSL